MNEENKGANGEENSEASPAASEENKEEKTESESTPSPEENKEQVQNKPIPFHEDPKVQEYLDRREAKIREELEKEFETKFGQKPTKEDTEADIPEWFGGDLKQWKAFKADRQRELDTAVKQAIDLFKSSSQQEQKANEDRVKEANDWLEHSVTTIESLTGKKVDRNALFQFVYDNKLIDAQGRWDYFKGFNQMQNKSAQTNDASKEKLNEKKKLADATTKDGSKPESDQRTYKTSEDFKKEKPW